MKLNLWMDSKGLTQVDLALVIKRGPELTGRDKVRAHRIYKGAYVPSKKDEMPKILLWTQGEVQPNDFYDLPPLPNVNHSKAARVSE